MNKIISDKVSESSYMPLQTEGTDILLRLINYIKLIIELYFITLYLFLLIVNLYCFLYILYVLFE
jgi:hypothetical protein